MKKQTIILLAAGVFLACLLYKAGRKAPDTAEYIKPGDKSNEVYALQAALTQMAGVKFSNMGAYDKDTLAAVQYYMKGCNCLIDFDKGYVGKDFAKDLLAIEQKLNIK